LRQKRSQTLGFAARAFDSSFRTYVSECRRIEHEQTTIQNAKKTVGSSGRLLWTRITIGKRLRRHLLKGPNNFRHHLIRNNTSRSKVAQSRNSERRRTELARLTKKKPGQRPGTLLVIRKAVTYLGSFQPVVGVVSDRAGTLNGKTNEISTMVGKTWDNSCSWEVQIL
jgi:hypothetical protein